MKKSLCAQSSSTRQREDWLGGLSLGGRAELDRDGGVYVFKLLDLGPSQVCPEGNILALVGTSSADWSGPFMEVLWGGGLFLLLNGCFCYRGVCAGGPFPFLPLLLWHLSQRRRSGRGQRRSTGESPFHLADTQTTPECFFLWEILKPMKWKLMCPPKSFLNLGLRHKSHHLNLEEHLFYRTVKMFQLSETIIRENNRLRFVSRGHFGSYKSKMAAEESQFFIVRYYN